MKVMRATLGSSVCNPYLTYHNLLTTGSIHIHTRQTKLWYVAESKQKYGLSTLIVSLLPDHLLCVTDALFDPKFDMCFCGTCHAQRGDKAFYTRGKPTKRYGIPVGWCRFALK